jgi:hypothetical protein
LLRHKNYHRVVRHFIHYKLPIRVKLRISTTPGTAQGKRGGQATQQTVGGLSKIDTECEAQGLNAGFYGMSCSVIQLSRIRQCTQKGVKLSEPFGTLLTAMTGNGPPRVFQSVLQAGCRGNQLKEADRKQWIQGNGNVAGRCQCALDLRISCFLA